MLQNQLGFIPDGATILNDNLAVHTIDKISTFYNSGGPILVCDREDRISKRLTAALLYNMKLGSLRKIAASLGICKNTVVENHRKYVKGGITALQEHHRPRSPHKLIGSTLEEAQEYINQGMSNYKIADKLNLTEGGIRYALKTGRLRPSEKAKKTKFLKVKSSSFRAIEDLVSANGIAVKRHADRAKARTGKIIEAPPEFEAQEGVQKSGVLIALPILLATGLLDISKKVYGSLSNSYYGIRTIFLTLAFMSLLRIKNPEQLSGYSPGELGILLGLDRFPEIKTLRRKLKELGDQKKGSEFQVALAKKWLEDTPDNWGFLYIDGHVRPYHGRKHKIRKTHVARRRLCMPATTDTWVNDTKAEPLFLFTSSVHEGLLSMLDNKILPSIRNYVGAERRVTLIFDREGWSPKSFAKWYKNKFDVITYRKGSYQEWPNACFCETIIEDNGHKKKFLLGERSIQLFKKFWVREVRRLCDNGHQTSIITTRQDLSIKSIAIKMFARWKQENFFRYMRQEFALDHLWTYNFEQGDPDHLVPNPEKKELKKKLDKTKMELAALVQKYGEKAIDNPESKRPTMRGFKISQGMTGKKIRVLREVYHDLTNQIKRISDKVPLKQIMIKKEIVQFEKEQKKVTDAVKMISYRAESSLFSIISPFFKRSNEEGRKFLKAVFQQSADIIPDENKKKLTVSFHGMANPVYNKVLSKLCEAMNEYNVKYPGTQYQLNFTCYW